MAVAIPSYRDAKARSQVIRAVSVGNEFVRSVLLDISRSSTEPTHITFRNNNFAQNSNIAVDNMSPFTVLYWDIVNTNFDVYVALYLGSLYVSDFQPATSGSNLGKKSRLAFVAKKIGGNYAIFCGGLWGDANLEIPKEYRPSNCQCDNLGGSFSSLGVTEFCDSNR